MTSGCQQVHGGKKQWLTISKGTQKFLKKDEKKGREMKEKMKEKEN